MIDQAKWYEIRLGVEEIPIINYKYHAKRKVLKYITFVREMCLEIKIKRAYYCRPNIVIFCGQKKLKKLIIEANLLGLEDSLIIFERKGEK